MKLYHTPPFQDHSPIFALLVATGYTVRTTREGNCYSGPEIATDASETLLPPGSTLIGSPVCEHSRITEEECREFVRWFCRARHFRRMTPCHSHVPTRGPVTIYGLESKRVRGKSLARAILFSHNGPGAEQTPQGPWRSMENGGEIYADLASMIERKTLEMTQA